MTNMIVATEREAGPTPPLHRSPSPSPETWRASYRPSPRGAEVALDLRAATLGEVAAAFSAWRATNRVDYHTVTFERGVVVTPLHLFFSVSRLDLVVEYMRTAGAPRIRAYFDAESDAWFALEGTHRLRAAAILGVAPVLVPVRWRRGWRALERARYAVARRAHVFPRVEVDAPPVSGETRSPDGLNPPG